jgi:hypothetical protein
MRLNLLLLIILSSSSCFSQAAREYFFPLSNKNVSVYTMKGVPKHGQKIVVYFKEMGDSALITTVYPNYEGKLGWKKEIVKIDDSKISLVKVNSNIYNPQTFEVDEVFLLKIPENSTSSASQYVQ